MDKQYKKGDRQVWSMDVDATVDLTWYAEAEDGRTKSFASCYKLLAEPDPPFRHYVVYDDIVIGAIQILEVMELTPERNGQVLWKVCDCKE